MCKRLSIYIYVCVCTCKFRNNSNMFVLLCMRLRKCSKTMRNCEYFISTANTRIFHTFSEPAQTYWHYWRILHVFIIGSRDPRALERIKRIAFEKIQHKQLNALHERKYDGIWSTSKTAPQQSHAQCTHVLCTHHPHRHVD